MHALNLKLCLRRNGDCMNTNEKRYYILVNAIRDAIHNIDNQNYGYARNALVILQQMVEEITAEADEPYLEVDKSQ